VTDLPSIIDLLDLEYVEQDLYRSRAVYEASWGMFGGQAAAQALYAAGLTVEKDRLPHSLHGYFLRRGDTSKPTLFRVDRDRDGRSFSARRVVAVQDGSVIFSMSASFTAQVSPDRPMPDLESEPVSDLPSPQTVSSGRGWYTATIYAADGTRIASVAQEQIFTTRRQR
jgi:acyl-CoA thioesterase-2